MASSDFIAWRAAYGATLEPVDGEDAFFAFHCEMNRMLDKAGSGFEFGFRFGTPEFPSLASAWSPSEARLVDSARHMGELDRLMVLEIDRGAPGTRTSALAIGLTNGLSTKAEDNAMSLARHRRERRGVQFDQNLAPRDSEIPLTRSSRKLPPWHSDIGSADARCARHDGPAFGPSPGCLAALPASVNS